VYCKALINSKINIIFLLLLIPGVLFCQTRSGRILSSLDNKGIPWVNIGITGKNIGTVTDEDGNFILNVPEEFKDDSVMISAIGYVAKTVHVHEFHNDAIDSIYLEPATYDLPEISVRYHRASKAVLGNPMETASLKSGFSENELGSELGIMISTKKHALIQDIVLNIAVCTYDSVFYRLNIYRVNNGSIEENILTRPVYISFSGYEADVDFTYDLSSYSIVFQGDVLVALELYKDLGEGKLLFNTEYFTGITYHRKISQGEWFRSPGEIGMSLNCIMR